ncbi:MAG: 2-hydroxyacid dehydrogenase [Deltaproteobacteria bacterium]|nr:2-hydroxyacid dehydrogenase [Deltaproteobacteria bacterium]
MKVLFAAPENAWGGFLGLIRSELPEHSFEATGQFRADNLKGYDVLIPTMCSVTEQMITKSDRLRLIQQCGSGLEGVDVDAAIKNNIWVANVPTASSGNADSVAEIGIYMMIGLSRNFKNMAQSMLAGKMGEPQGKSLCGKTVGLVGLGGIGQALIKRLKAFDVHLIGIKQNNPHQAQKDLGLEWVGRPDELDHLARKSDFLILCLPMNQKNRNIISKITFANMKPDSFLINLSRGGLVDRGALEEALASGKIGGAGLDVFWEEPPDPDDPIFNFNVLATPHISGSTDVSMQGIVKGVAENIRRIAKGLEPLNNKNTPVAD